MFYPSLVIRPVLSDHSREEDKGGTYNNSEQNADYDIETDSICIHLYNEAVYDFKQNVNFMPGLCRVWDFFNL